MISFLFKLISFFANIIHPIRLCPNIWVRENSGCMSVPIKFHKAKIKKVYYQGVRAPHGVKMFYCKYKLALVLSFDNGKEIDTLYARRSYNYLINDEQVSPLFNRVFVYDN